MDSDGVDAGDAAVAGRAVVRTVAGVEDVAPASRAAAERALAAHDVAEVREDAWYPLDAFCDALVAVAAATDADAVRTLGRRVADGLDPGACGSVPEALANLDATHGDIHRGDAGGYGFRRIGERDGRIECETPYPCPFDRGFVEGVAAAGADGVVRLSEVGVCQADDAPRCTYHLHW